MRMIDAIEFQQRMCAFCDQEYSGIPCEPGDCVFIRALNETPTLTTPSQWVSVEERLPEPGEGVLAIVSGKPEYNITLQDAYELGRFAPDWGWIIDECPELENPTVTWWMPLPELPEKKEDQK